MTPWWKICSHVQKFTYFLALQHTSINHWIQSEIWQNLISVYLNILQNVKFRIGHSIKHFWNTRTLIHRYNSNKVNCHRKFVKSRIINIETNKSHYLPTTFHQLPSEILSFNAKHKISWFQCGINTILTQVSQIFSCNVMCTWMGRGDFLFQISIKVRESGITYFTLSVWTKNKAS
jgi:hypothetical protein